MYVVKVGEYYVRRYTLSRDRVLTDIVLSYEIMGGFTFDTANILATKLKGRVIKMSEETTCE